MILVLYHQISFNSCSIHVKFNHTLFYNVYKHICLQITWFLCIICNPHSPEHFGHNFYVMEIQNIQIIF